MQYVHACLFRFPRFAMIDGNECGNATAGKRQGLI